MMQGLLIFLTLPLFGFVAAVSPPIVDLGYAKYQGTFNSTTNQTEFLSIRYAAPPLGLSFNNPYAGRP